MFSKSAASDCGDVSSGEENDVGGPSTRVKRDGDEVGPIVQRFHVSGQGLDDG